MMEGGHLTVHRGAQLVSREELAIIPAPPATDTWKPVSHIALVETIAGVMADRGLYITKEQFAVQGPRLFGVFDTEWQKMSDFGAAVGFRHGINKDLAIHLLCGARVWLCDNLSYSGQQITVRKHSAKLNLGEEMDRALYKYMQEWRRFKDAIQLQKDTTLEERRVKQLVYDIFQAKILPLRLFPPVTTHVLQMTKEAKTAMTGWWLHNVMTTHIKTLAPAPAFRATARLGKFFAAKF